ncbi:MAG: hypothetical protein ACRES7_08390, partial [Gammaproteobacteria bacterium]
MVLRGTTAIIGASYATVGGIHQGAAYVFTETGGTWSQVQKLSADDGATGDDFGWAVAFSGTTAIIGAPNGGAGGVGVAYIFTKPGGIWSQVQELTESDTNIFQFGWSVAVDGTNALVGANCGYDPSLDECDYSKGYAFAETDGTWNQIAIPFGGGSAVALSGTTAVTTEAPYFEDPDYGYTQGTATVYTLSNGTWTQSAEFYGNINGYDDFGDSVAISGNTVLVGADHLTGGDYGEPAPGTAFEHTESNNGNWTQTQEFAASDGAEFDLFGNAVAVSGTTRLIGAWEAMINGNFEGAAYFESNGDLGLAVSAPQTVGQNQTYVSQTIATNNASAASPAVAVKMPVPAAATFVSASATQGSCSEDSGVVSCAFGSIEGNAGTATANVTLKATGEVGTTIENTASVAKATPALTASAPTTITTA